VKFFGDVGDQNCLRFQFGEKGVDDAVIDTGKSPANLRAIQYVTEFSKNWLAYEEEYCTIEKQPQRLSGGAVTISNSLYEEIAVKDDARYRFGHRLFVATSFLANSLLGLSYQLVQFFFRHSTLIKAPRDWLNYFFKRSLGKNCRFEQFQRSSFGGSSLPLRRLGNGVNCIRITYFND